MRRLVLSHPSRLTVTLLWLALTGCDAERTELSTRNFTPMAPMAKVEAMPGERGIVVDASLSMTQDADVTKSKEAATAGRKIIYTGSIDLVTENLTAFEAKLGQLIDSHRAYIADSDRSGTAGASLRGMWKVRVPVDRYDPL